MNPVSKELIDRVRAALIPWQSHITEKRMFGGTCFLYKGKMCVGEIKQQLMVRIVAEKMEDALKKPEVFPMDFTGKPLKEFVYVSLEGLTTEERLQNWVELGMEHAKLKTKS